MFSAIHTLNEDSHRLIRRSRLHFIVCALALVAAHTEELVGRHGLVALQLPLFALLPAMDEVSPALITQRVGVDGTDGLN